MMYKIIESTLAHFKNIELSFDFSNYAVGNEISILGMQLIITQIGAEIIGCSNSDSILILQKIST